MSDQLVVALSDSVVQADPGHVGPSQANSTLPSIIGPRLDSSSQSGPGQSSAALLSRPKEASSSEMLLELNKEISKALLKVKIPAKLNDLLKLVAATGSTQLPWPKIKSLFRVKIEQVIHEFNSNSSEIPIRPNVDPFNLEAVKAKVFEHLDSFVEVPLTVQRLAELLTSPRYNSLFILGLFSPNFFCLSIICLPPTKFRT